MTYRTGIVPLDMQLNGGIPKGRVVLIFEEPGAGAEVFSYHFAIEGARIGDKVLYITTEESEDETREVIEKYFGLKGEEWEYITILSIQSNKESKAKDYLKRTIYDAISGIKTIILNEEFQRVIINDLIYFLKNYEVNDIMKFLDFLAEEAKKRGFAVLLLTTKGIFDTQFEILMKRRVDIVFDLSLKEVENELQRRLKIIKLKGMQVPKAILRYELTEKGIKMESVMRVL
ncbi:MAG: RAD55 family ATPase [Archaeoglobales archaeon]|nr:RAD55 family ATPase [Archaeoglobales archaeon]